MRASDSSGSHGDRGGEVNEGAAAGCIGWFGGFVPVKLESFLNAACLRLFSEVFRLFSFWEVHSESSSNISSCVSSPFLRVSGSWSRCWLYPGARRCPSRERTPRYTNTHPVPSLRHESLKYSEHRTLQRLAANPSRRFTCAASVLITVWLKSMFYWLFYSTSTRINLKNARNI